MDRRILGVSIAAILLMSLAPAGVAGLHVGDSVVTKDSKTVPKSTIMIVANITNSSSRQPFTYVVSVRDESGVTTFVAWASGDVPANGWREVALSWIPEASGRYTVETFLFRAMKEPVALGRPISTNVTIGPKGEVTSDSNVGSELGMLLIRVGELRISGAGFVGADNPPTVKVSKKSYVEGETVHVTGTAPRVERDSLTFVPTQALVIQVFNPRGIVYAIGQPAPNANGAYSFDFRIGGDKAVTGLYTVNATQGGKNAQTAFEVGEDFTKKKWPRLTTDEGGTPFQRAILQEVAELQTAGKPHPKILENDVNVTKTQDSKGHDVVRIEGKIALKYDNPEQAGKKKWDELTIGKFDVPEKIKDKIKNNNAEEGDYTDDVVAKIRALPSGSDYTYGEEPRIYTVQEAFTITYAEKSLEPMASDTAGPSIFAIPSAYAEEFGPKPIVMGFTIDPPDIDWTIDETIESCIAGGPCFTIVDAEAGFEFKLDFGLRFPVEVTVNAPGNMVWGNGYPLTTSLQPLDLDAQQYDDLGVPPMDGNEFDAEFRLFAGFLVTTIADIPVVDFGITDLDTNLVEQCLEKLQIDCGNFVTPFGFDENGNQRLFSLPPVTFDPDQTGLEYSYLGMSLGLGLGLAPHIASNKIGTSWDAGGDSIPAQGVAMDIEYMHDATSRSFGPIDVADHSAIEDAIVSMDGFKFYFDQLFVGVAANVQFGGFLQFIPPTPYVEIVRFDLSELVEGSDLYLGQHPGTEGMTASIPVRPPGIDVSVVPIEADIGVPTTFLVNFIDRGTGVEVAGVSHTFMILKDGLEIFSAPENPAGIYEFQFEEEHRGTVQIVIETADERIQHDHHVKDVAVVPEFPAGPVIAFAAVLGIMFMLVRFRDGIWKPRIASTS